MKYRYKISYGGTSSTSSSFVPIYTTTNEKQEKLDYFANEMTKIIKNLNKEKRNYKSLEEIYDIYNLDNYKIVKNNQLKILIPEIIKIYSKYYTEYFNNEELNKNIETSSTESVTYIKDNTKNFNEKEDYNSLENKYSNTYVIKQTLPIGSKIIYLGDYHSSAHSLIDIIKNLQYYEILNEKYELKEGYYMVFLGDIVDRGPLGIECLYIIYLLFLINNLIEERVFILNEIGRAHV